MEDMNRSQRIQDMEEALDLTAEALQRLAAALEQYQDVLPQLETLTAYMDSGQWLKDYEADEAGEIPSDLKRGVLSQDALYDLLRQHRGLLDTMEELSHPQQNLG